jgi:CRISPR-associated protein Cas2
MIIIAYDFSDNKVRTKFSKFINKFGKKVQYSVYEVRNSPRILQNILKEIELTYKQLFQGSDSILIFQICEGDKKKVIRYGYSANDNEEVLIF